MLGTGDVIDARWEVERRIGAGGLGAVFLCRDPQDGSEVAVKVLNVGMDAGGAGVRKRVVREARALQRLDHPCIVRVRDVGEDANRGVVFLVMDYVRGASLETVEQLPAARVRELMWNLLDALGHAHVQGIAHRDLKPGNVLVREDDGLPVLVDWGSAYVPANERLTRSLDNQGLGLTPQYAPPEALLDPAGADPYLWDVYAMGVLAHVLLTGDPTPFGGEREAQVAAAKTLSCLDPGPGFDADLRSLVRLATSPAARHRPEGAVGALDLLRRPAEMPVPVSRKVSHHTIVARKGEADDDTGVHEVAAQDAGPPLDTLVSRPRGARVDLPPEPTGLTPRDAGVPWWPFALAGLLAGAGALVLAAGMLLVGAGDASPTPEAPTPVEVTPSPPAEAEAVAEAVPADSDTDGGVEETDDSDLLEADEEEAGADGASAATTPAAPVKRTRRKPSAAARAAAAEEAAAEEAAKAAAALEAATARVTALQALGPAGMVQELADDAGRTERYAQDLGRLRAGGQSTLARESLDQFLKGLKTARPKGVPGLVMRNLAQRGDLGSFLNAVWASGLQGSLAPVVVDAIATEAPLAARSPEDARDCRTATPYLRVLLGSTPGRKVGWVPGACATCDKVGAVVEACDVLR